MDVSSPTEENNDTSTSDEHLFPSGSTHRESENLENMDMSNPSEANNGASKSGKHLFPAGYTYKQFPGELEIEEVKDKDSAMQWVAMYSKHSKTTWRIMRTYKVVGKRVIYKQAWRCHHNVQERKYVDPTKPKRKKISKNLDCPAQLIITILKLYNKKAKTCANSDTKCIVRHNLHHNHHLETAAVLRFNKMGDDVKEKLLQLFKEGHSATSARDALKLDLLVNDPEYWKHSADGRYLPTVAICQRLLNSTFPKTHDAESGANMDKDKEKRSRKRNIQDPCAKAMFNSIFETATGDKLPPEWLLPLDAVPESNFGGNSDEEGIESESYEEEIEASSNPVIVRVNTEPTHNKSTLTGKEKSALESLFQRIRGGIESNPKVFDHAIRIMLSNADKYVKTDTALATSMRAFGVVLPVTKLQVAMVKTQPTLQAHRNNGT